MYAADHVACFVTVLFAGFSPQVLSFVTMIVVAVQAVYMIVYIAKEWNKEIIEYTLKAAVTG